MLAKGGGAGIPAPPPYLFEYRQTKNKKTSFLMNNLQLITFVIA